MANLAFRRDTVLYVHESGFMAPGAGYRVGAYEVGAIVAAASADATATVDAGHGFAIGDKALLNPGADNDNGYDAYLLVDSVSATTVVFTSVVSLAVGDVLFNLGPDTGATQPNYDGSGVAIYSDMDGGTAIASENVTADSAGNFQYWHEGADIWEIYLDADGIPVGSRTGSSGDALVGPTGDVTDNSFPRFDGTTGRRLQGGQTTESDDGNVSVVGNLTIGDALNHDGTTAGFYAQTPVTRPSAYTQTYATADKTHAGRTAADLTDNTGGAVGVTLAAGVGISTLSIPIQLAAMTTSAADLITNYVLGYKFKILSVSFVTTTIGAGAGATQALNLEIGTTNVTGGVVTVTLAGTDTLGEKTDGTAITALNTGSAADTLSLEVAAGGTVFTGGAGVLLISIQNMDVADAFASLADQADKNRVDALDTSSIVNSLIDDMQNLGLVT